MINRISISDVLLAFAIGIVLGVSGCATIMIDKSVSAADGNASTVVVSAPGSSHGYAYLEIGDGANPTDVVTVIPPNVACRRESCISWQITRNGNVTASGGLPKGQIRLELPVSVITASAVPVSQSIDGEYRLLMRMFYTGPDGEEYSVVARSLIRIVVTRKDYIAMGCNDPVVMWRSPIAKDCEAQYSTAMRSARCGRCGVPVLRGG